MTLQTASRGELRLEDVAKAFGSQVAVAGVSTTIGDGEFFSLLGPSGCGKTTTLRLVAGFERCDRGRILLAGEDLAPLPPERRRVNTVFQHYALFPHMTVEDNVGYGLRHSARSKTEAMERLQRALTTVRLTELRKRYPRELSGGQQQRVALARALVNEPRVLLLDEPLAALDLKLRKAMQQELKKLQERVGITFVYVTHDQEEALTLSDRIAVMNGGRILQEGTPAEIYERPATRFVADFIGETNFFDGTVEEVGNPIVVRDSDGRRLLCAPSAVANTSHRITVSVRPEAISMGAVEDANAFDGLLQRTVYLGDMLEHHVQLDGGKDIVVRTSGGARNEGAFNVGERIRVGWRVEDALIVVDEGDAVADEDARHLVGTEELVALEEEGAK